MLKEVITRKLMSLKVFSNAWNSQSAAEGSNALLRKFEIGPANSLAVVFDKMSANFEREQVRTREKQNKTANLSPLIAGLGNDLSKKSFGMVLDQFNQGLSYFAVGKESNVYEVSRKGLQDAIPRIVTRNSDNEWICSCNMHVYLGIPCRHILCVLVTLNVKVTRELVNSRWFRDALQPEFTLKNPSPFSTKQGSKVIDPAEPQEVAAIEEGESDQGLQGEEEFQDFDSYLAANGGHYGEDSNGEEGVFVINGSKNKSLKVTPKEMRNELSNEFYQLLQKIGFGKESISKMESLKHSLREWEEKNLKEEGSNNQFQLPSSIRTLGKPPMHALKPGNQKPRLNGVKSKKTYKCSICKNIGHKAGSKCPYKCFSCPGTKHHKKGECPSKKRSDKDEQEEGDQESQAAKKQKQDGSTVSFSKSTGKVAYFSHCPHVLTSKFQMLLLIMMKRRKMMRMAWS